MARNHHKIRVWLAIAVVIASLGLTSAASARYLAEDTGGIPVESSPVPIEVTSGGSFDWGAALVGAGVAIGAALCVGGATYVVRHRSHVAA
jgi:hypothetical protein